ncbi:TPA: hypothetical protein NV918_004072 [Escherichia coli]|uniref:hypothetical protein n=1 Tax=Escherichia coli TaxID=562 RepID=UPI000F547953|nr:hypothetical protein [Escherichia coli]HCJ9051644.1 hypothetical protein [Escherichia coli]HCJ9056231.1 hypothetical protein [Escherichia coli]HCJ9415602.1 hypothetical protein [Escherichia coli]
MTTITREQALKIIEAADEVISALAGTNEDVHPGSDNMLRLWDDLNDRHAPPEVVRELARIALASLEAEPLCYLTWHQGFRAPDDCEEYVVEAKPGDKSCDGTPAFPVYTAPPVPVSVPTFEKWCELTEQKPVGWVRDAMKEAYDACRAAMLHSAEPVSQAYKLNALDGNSPVAQDGLLGCGENCWSCGKYFTYEQHSECDGYCPHCNSPVDLDDEEDQPSKVVPTNPTEEMISNAWREAIGKCDHETIKRIYATMLAAAPQQEVK